MKNETYLLIRMALLKAQEHIKNEIKRGDALGVFKDQLEENTAALIALKWNR